MSIQNGISEGTYDRFIIDSGVVRVGYVDGDNPGVMIGALRGGSSFVVEREMREMVVDGAPGPVKGSQRPIKLTAKITANIVEWSTDFIKLMLPGVTAADYPEITPTHKQITGGLSIAAADYTDSVAIIGQVSGTDNDFIGIIKNALSLGNLEISLNDKDEAVGSLELVAHFDPSDLTAAPWEIRWPSDVDQTTEGE